ncbi:unnamed protein product [Rotaria sp. Silwood2]|nr:unnamed protein product [Rotaria sp. Silwood2]CAF2648131.1 unnamed protein product [Rotaria sp. Silwood2]CAF2917666.1 unnamed protein product [Rotaria sp. Silwood2]CAF3060022.1 unnamed protein product [Rotaria sp. Silwood2]CAF4052918.1 unnamed protein product [Rotaria sp. Silwood2]
MPVLKSLFRRNYAEDNLRIIITRHGERADIALGPHWFRNLRKTGGRYSGVSYLVPRPDDSEWENDPPLTIRGEHQSRSTGRKLLQLGYPIDYCYSSPAYRSVQTASKILESQGRKAVPINIEPGLFECSSWHRNAPLSFIPPEYLAADKHFNIDPYYTPVYNTIDAVEDEGSYYQRSRLLIDAIVKAHKHQGGTILLSGHAGSIEVITRGMLGRSARPERLHFEADKVDFCNFAILERDANTNQWLIHPPYSNESYYSGHENIPSTIPLHRATSQYIGANPLRGSSSYSEFYPLRNKLYRYY